MSENKVLDYFNLGQKKHRSSQTAYLCVRGSSEVAGGTSEYTCEMEVSLSGGSHAEH
jgi:hypothetical protein